MKKVFGLGLTLGLIFGANTVLFAQDGQGTMPPPPPPGKWGKRDGGDGMRGGKMRGGRDRMRGGKMGGMHRGGFGIRDEELAKINLTNDQKVKVFDFKKKMADEREAMMKNRMNQPRPEMNREEMRQLMSAKQLGTLTPEQKTKLDSIEANRKQMMEKRKTEMEAMRAKMEQNQQEFLNIFTLDQRKQIEQMRADRMKQMEERRKAGDGMRKRGMKPEGQPKPNM